MLNHWLQVFHLFSDEQVNHIVYIDKYNKLFVKWAEDQKYPILKLFEAMT